jgi:MerR family transcriptional regulator, light-induced transcriptional regulator
MTTGRLERVALANIIRAAKAGGEPADPPEGTTTDLSVFVQTLLQGDRRAATTVAFEALDRGVSIVDVYGGMFQAAMYEIGRMWEANEITVAQEHMATAVTQAVVDRTFARFPMPASVRGNVVITGVRGELHHLGARLVADVLEAEGWRVRFLGTDLPRSGIVAAVADHHAVAVGISATMLSSVPEVRDLIAELRTAPGPRLVVLVGGAAFRVSPELVAEVGADGRARGVDDAGALLQGLMSA